MANRQPTIIILTISDLFYEANLHRKVKTLIEQGFRVRLFCSYHPALNKELWADVELVQIKLRSSPTVLRFFQFWFKATWWLLKQKADLFIAYDFLPLVPLRIKSFFQNCNYIYDSVELVSGLNSLVKRPIRRFFFRMVERFGVGKARAAFTVCESDAKALKNTYPHLNVAGFVRNIPYWQEYPRTQFLREQFQIPSDKKIGIYQGMVFEGRGLPEIIQACSHIKEVVLFIVGDGPLRPELEKQVEKLQMSERVIFTGMVPFDQLANYTYSADFGFTVITGQGLSYYHALPNKLFEYIQAQIPVIGSNYPEISKIIEKEQIGFVVDPKNITALSEAVRKIIKDDVYQEFKKNLRRVAKKYTWQEESKKYIELIEQALPKKIR